MLRNGLREVLFGVAWACVFRVLVFAYPLCLIPNDPDRSSDSDSSELELDSLAGDLARGSLILLALVDRE